MISARIEIIGLFQYDATVVFPRRRTPVRVTMFGRTNYEFPEISRSNTTESAVFKLADDAGRTVYRGYDGRLWSPIPSFSATPVTVEHYRTLLNPTFDANPGRLAPRGLNDLHPSDPISKAAPRLPLPESRYPTVPLNDSRQDETRFRGRVLWSNRSESMALHRRAAVDLLSIDGIVHARTAAPHWDVNPIRSTLNLLDGDPTMSQQFRHDRRDDAVDFSQRLLRRDLPVVGEILDIDPTYAASDDIARAFRHIDIFAMERITSYARILVPDAVAALGRLLHGAIHSGNDVDGVHDPESATTDLDVLAAACASDRLPPDIAETLLLNLGSLPSRMNFEREFARTPARPITPKDADALVDAAKTPPQ